MQRQSFTLRCSYRVQHHCHRPTEPSKHSREFRHSSLRVLVQGFLQGSAFPALGFGRNPIMCACYPAATSQSHAFTISHIPKSHGPQRISFCSCCHMQQLSLQLSSSTSPQILVILFCFFESFSFSHPNHTSKQHAPIHFPHRRVHSSLSLQLELLPVSSFVSWIGRSQRPVVCMHAQVAWASCSSDRDCRGHSFSRGGGSCAAGAARSQHGCACKACRPR